MGLRSKALDEAVLLRLARRNVVPAGATLVSPAQDRIRRQLGAVVADNGAGLAASTDHIVQLAGNTPARDRAIGDERQALPSAVIDDCQDAEAPAIDQLVVNEVEAPALIRHQRHLDRPPGSQRPLASTAPAHAQPLLPVETLHRFRLTSWPSRRSST